MKSMVVFLNKTLVTYKNLQPLFSLLILLHFEEMKQYNILYHISYYKMPTIKLKTFKIRYSSNKVEDGVKNFLKAVEKEAGWLIVACLYIRSEKYYIIYIKFNYQMCLTRMKSIMKVSGVDLDDITIGKPAHGVSENDLLAAFTRYGLSQGEVPYVTFCDNLMDKYKNTLIDFDIR